MIGQRRLAKALADIPLWEHPITDDWDSPLPSRRWQYIGRGGFRHAFLGPDGRVYKRLTQFAEGCDPDANRDEWKFYCINENNMPTGFQLPQMHYFEDLNIIVQEYIDGLDAAFIDDLSATIQDAQNFFGFIDWDGVGNIKIKNDILYVIDFGV